MTVFIAKAASRFYPLAPFEFGQDFSFFPLSARRLFLRVLPARGFLSSLFLALTLILAIIYIVEINSIIIRGRKIPSLEATLSSLRHEQKLKAAEFAAKYSPAAVKRDAVVKVQMVEVKGVQYVREAEEVASNFVPIP